VATRDSLLLPEQAWPLEISEAREQALRQLAQSIQKDESALTVLSPHAPGMHGEILDAPSLVIEDHGGIRLFEHSGDEAYSYRALLLAGDDDLVTIGVARHHEFEAYCRDCLGLGSPLVLIQTWNSSPAWLPTPKLAAVSISCRTWEPGRCGSLQARLPVIVVHRCG